MGKKSKNSENIRVVIRVRGLLDNELQRGDKSAVKLDMATQQVIVSHPIGDPDVFAFDAVYNNSFTQHDIFLQEVQPMIESVLQGYCATVFAYGQSGSGKTYTMTGNLKDNTLWGMMPQAVDYLFKKLKEVGSNTKTYKVRASYVELYNGKSRDLLCDKQVNLDIKENLAKNFYVKGCEQPTVTSLHDCIKLFNAGTIRRQTASTDLNDHSSRSHALFMLAIEQYDFEQDPTSPMIITSKLNIVDLAGSEKLSKTNATGETAHEGCNINLSLSALATVIDTIVKGAKHIPYRGNPLTMLLKDSLGGNSKTVMFANIGPSDKNVSESISALRFATRAKQIENKPIKNIDPKDAKIQELLEKIEKLQKKLGVDYNPQEEENLQQRIEVLEIENAELKGRHDKDNLELEESNRNLQASMEHLQKSLEEKIRDAQQLQQDKEIGEANLKSEAEYCKEIKFVIINFIRRVMTGEQIKGIRAKIPKTGDYNRTNDNWEIREIQFYLEGFLELYESWRKHYHTEEDMKKYAEKVGTEKEDGLRRQLVEAVHQRDELARQQQEVAIMRRGENEVQAKLKAELTSLTEENNTLREKIERDQEKMKEKLLKVKNENKVTEEELINTKMSFDAAKRDIGKLKKLLEESGERSGAGGGVLFKGGSFRSGSINTDKKDAAIASQLEQITHDRDCLHNRMCELLVILKKKGISDPEINVITAAIKANKSEVAFDDTHQLSLDANDSAECYLLTTADEEPPDGDLLGLLQQQICLQHRLEELRHAHQKKLDDMVRKFELLKTGKATANSTEEHGRDSYGDVGGVSQEILMSRIEEALQTKEEELAILRVESEKALDKLVKKLNKRQSELKDLEKTMSEERVSFEEEKKELASQNDELQHYNQKLTVEVENLRGKLSEATSTAESSTRAKDNEIAYHKKEIEKFIQTVDDIKQKYDSYDKVLQEFSRLKEQNRCAEATLKEKMEQLENNRQQMKWRNDMLETEKKRTRELEEALRQQETHMNQMEVAYNQEIAEHTNKLVAINNKRLADQAEEYMQVIAGERENQDSLREKFKSAKSKASKAAQRYDEMVLENEMLQTQFEELKVSAMKIFKEKQEAQRDLDAVTATGRPGGVRVARGF